MASLKWIAEWLRNNVPIIGGTLAWIVEQIEEAWDWLVSTAYDIAKKAWDWITSSGATIWNWIVSTGKWLVDKANEIATTIENAVLPVVRWLEEQAKRISDIIVSVVTPIVEGIERAVNWVASRIEEAANWIATTGRWLYDQVTSIPNRLAELWNNTTKLFQQLSEGIQNLGSELHNWWLWAYKSTNDFLTWIENSMKQALRDFIVWLALEVVKALINDLFDVQYDVDSGKVEGEYSSPLTSLVMLETEVE